MRERVRLIPCHQVFNLDKTTHMYIVHIIWHALGYLGATCGMHHLSLPRAGPLSLLFMHCFAFVHLIGLKNNDKQVALPFWVSNDAP